MKFVVKERDDENSFQIKHKLISTLEKNKWIYDPDNPEIVICVGGDGTILRAIHDYLIILDQVMFVGLHTGTLGFLTDYVQEEMDAFIYDLVHKIPKIENRPMLEIEIPAMNHTVYAFNEVRIESILKTLKLDIYIDGEFFEKTRASGICVSTQAGSSAINRALNGAVVDNGIDVLQLCEIMPISNKTHHSLKNAYIMREDRKITVKGELQYANACYDHLVMNIGNVDEIHIRTSEKKVRFARYRTYSYLERLKNIY